MLELHCAALYQGFLDFRLLGVQTTDWFSNRLAQLSSSSLTMGSG